MSKKYVIEVVIEEGSDEFWEEATKDNKSGCDTVLDEIQDIILNSGFPTAEIRLIKFEDK